ncbi:MAG: tRNA-5-methyluridine(54) 2-sulfurtransferase [Candidatus Woesearchaeota archaeon]|nr:tRNA-5-methyluridine(54) 2-sulfurtransferase [Candidatus Woesearchaeota archaeon]
MKCKRCTKPQIYNEFCQDHFVEYFENLFYKTVKKYQLVKHSEKIAVACSGGKDSTVVLHLLNKKYKNVTALLIDEGIKGYRAKTLDDLKKFCNANNIKLTVVSFKEEFGFDLDQVNKKRLCTVCGTFRRYLLNKYARGYDKIVTGHNLDDEAQNILMNLLKKNINSLIRLGPVSGIIQDEMFVPRVKPLYFISEKEVKLYTYIKQFDIRHIECPYASSSMRNKVRDILNNYELNNPSSKLNLVKNFLDLDLKQETNLSTSTLNHCEKCGEPCTGQICSCCNLIQQIKPTIINNKG